MSTQGSTTSDLIDALGVAWTIHGLYPDAEAQPAFKRAVADARAVPTTADLTTISVGPGAFIVDGEEHHTERKAAERLAIRLYVHNVESLRIGADTEERDVVRLFEVLAREPDAVATAGGVGAALARDGVTAFSVVERAALGDFGESDDADRDEAVRAVMSEGLDPEAFAGVLMDAAGHDVEQIGKVVHVRYHDVLARLASDDPSGHESVVRSFVEAFFYLPDPAQIAVLGQFLEHQQAESDQAFLDQFAGHELATLSARLDTQAVSLLMDYARIVTDPEGDPRSEELLALLQASPEAVTSARELIASKISEQWGSIVDGESGSSRIEFDLPESRSYFYTVLEVFRDLLEIENRDDRFGRLMRIWSGKVVGAMRRGEFRRAELWLRSITDNPTFDSDRHAAVDAAMTSLVRAAIVDHLVAYYRVIPDPAPLLAIMSILGQWIADPLIDRLAEDESASDRRVLTELVAFASADDPAPVIARMTDERWYLVRNLAVALRKSGNDKAGVGLRSALGHNDLRVRVEALRGISVIEGSDGLDAIAGALGDSEEAVRTAALAALGGQDSVEAESRLIDALGSPSFTREQRIRTVELLGRDPSPEARELLVRMAGRRFVVTSNARLLRDTARRALEGSSHRRGPHE